MSAERIFPDRCSVAEIYEDLKFPNSSPRDGAMPYVVINMVSSLDGKASVSGRSGSIGSKEDRTAMRALRSKVDAVMVGSGTLRAEKVSLTSEGRKTPEPLAVIPSLSLDLPLKDNLLGATPDRTIVITTRKSVSRLRESKPSETRDSLEGARLLISRESQKGGLNLEDALRGLRSGYGVRRLLVEGGPSLNHALLSNEGGSLVDEIFLTLAPKALGGRPGESHTIIEGNPIDPRIPATINSIHISTNSEVFLRYTLNKP